MNNILQFSDANLTSDSLLLMDTSFILSLSGYDLYENGQADLVKRERECHNLINKIIDSNAMFAISTITYNELLSIIQRDLFKRNQCYNESDIKNLRSANSNKYISIVQHSIDEVNNYIRDLKSIVAYYPEVIGSVDNDLIKLANEIRIDHKIHGLNDAQQIAIALKEHFTHFVATDKDFNSINNDRLTILVDSNTYNKIE